MDGLDHRPLVAVLAAAGEAPLPGLDALRDEAEFRYSCTEQDLRTALAEAQVLLVTDFRSRMLQRVWPEARRLSWVHAASAGVDTLRFPELFDSPVALTNARGIFDQAIAEYVLGLVLAFAKGLPTTLALQRQRHWQHRESEPVAGRCLLVVGAGSIGCAIARLARAAGMRVEGIAGRAREAEAPFEAVHGPEGLLPALAEADFVVIAAPLTRATEGLFDARAFAAMKPGARLINIGRGPIVRTEALLAALEQGRLAAAALDVFEQEPLPETHPLWSMPNVIVSPHMAGDVAGWRAALGAQFVENFRRWRRGEELLNRVDKERCR